MAELLTKGNVVRGYRILEDFKVVGGMSKVTFGEKGGKQYFIKEFLAPKYPVPGSPGSEKTKEQKRKDCDAFEKHHQQLNGLIQSKVGPGGNLVMAIDFFREGTAYYKVTERIDTSSISCKDVAKLKMQDIVLLTRSVCHSVRILHSLNIVHGDLKPDNILLKKTSSGYSGKLIDFDDSYMSQKPPKDRESLVGTPDYYSPELADYIMDEDEEIAGSTLTLKSDVFTLGIILCEYFTGEKPVLSKDVKSTWLFVKKGGTISFAKKIPPKVEDIVRKMLSIKPEDRPTIETVFNAFKDPDLLTGVVAEEASSSTSEKIPEVAPKIKLGGSLFHSLGVFFGKTSSDRSKTSEPLKSESPVKSVAPIKPVVSKPINTALVAGLDSKNRMMFIKALKDLLKDGPVSENEILEKLAKIRYGNDSVTPLVKDSFEKDMKSCILYGIKRSRGMISLDLTKS